MIADSVEGVWRSQRWLISLASKLAALCDRSMWSRNSHFLHTVLEYAIDNKEKGQSKTLTLKQEVRDIDFVPRTTASTPRDRLELSTFRLTAERSAIELTGITHRNTEIEIPRFDLNYTQNEPACQGFILPFLAPSPHFPTFCFRPPLSQGVPLHHTGSG